MTAIKINRGDIYKYMVNLCKSYHRNVPLNVPLPTAKACALQRFHAIASGDKRVPFD